MSMLNSNNLYPYVDHFARNKYTTMTSLIYNTCNLLLILLLLLVVLRLRLLISTTTNDDDEYDDKDDDDDY